MEQVRVNSLTHMVVVVDENSGDSATAALESKLQVGTHTNGELHLLPRPPTHDSELTPPPSPAWLLCLGGLD